MNPAPLWRRFASIIYDGVVIIAIWMIVGFAVLALFGIDGNVEAQEGQVVLGTFYSIVLFAAMILSAFLFYAWFWTHSGQTIGMMAWNIRITNPDGSAISWWQSLVRFICGGVVTVIFGTGFWQYPVRGNLLIGGLLFALCAAFWVAAQLQGRMALTDRLSDSLVVRTEK